MQPIDRQRIVRRAVLHCFAALTHISKSGHIYDFVTGYTKRQLKPKVQRKEVLAAIQHYTNTGVIAFQNGFYEIL